MNLIEIKKRIEEIEKVIDDPEVAHGLEDTLYEDFIEYLAKNSRNKKIKLMAKEILKTQKLDFERWYA